MGFSNLCGKGSFKGHGRSHCGGCQCFGNEILGRLGARGRGTGKGAAGPAFVRRFQRTGAYVLLLSHARLPCSGIYLFR